jgi:hypothetical protein
MPSDHDRELKNRTDALIESTHAVVTTTQNVTDQTSQDSARQCRELEQSQDTATAKTILQTHQIRADRNSTAIPLTPNGKTSEHPEVCWRVIEGSTTRLLTCFIFTDSSAGVELRVGYVSDAPLHSKLVADTESARALAKQWLDTVRVLSPRPHDR